jgi:PAS domain S-box-containing protein
VENARALQRERDELRALLDRLPDLVAVHRSGTILWTNRAFTSALGHDLADVVGKPLIAVVARRSRPLVRDRMRMQPEALSAVPLTEIALATRTGEEVIVEVAPTQRVVFDGAPARLIVGRDVTDRVRMQQSLIIADRLASIGLLAAGVAHEVNNPLGYVLNNIEIARRALEPDATLARSALDVALEGVDRIRVIVRDLLMLARGGGPVGVIDVCEIAESTLALAARDIERTTALTLDLGPAPSVRASAPRIGQVLLALVVNALEAMRDRPREENSLVVRIATADDGRLLLEVSDTGRGIPDADLPRLFEPFFTTKPAGQGTGLGLAIAQQLVVELGGEITVASRPGLGTTFRVLLPGVTPDEDEDARAAESPAASLRE